jgi:HAL2 family 3'(2'),5'-bisphosphate nucleotidase
MDTAMQTTHELKAAIAAVRLASTVTQAVQKTLVTEDTLEKKDRSPVTVADFASQAVICKALADTFPNDPVVGEEDAKELREPGNAALLDSVVGHVAGARGAASRDDVLAWIDCGCATPPPDGSMKRYWTLDPIDGTKGFLRAGQYAIALALIEQGQVVLGVLGCPNLPAMDPQAPGEPENPGGEPGGNPGDPGSPGSPGAGVLMAAVRDGGAVTMPLNDATTDGTPIHVSGVSDPAQARFCESVESGHSNQSDSAKIAELLGITAEPVRMDSQAKYAAVARGEASIYLRLPTSAQYREKIWDHAAGAIVVQEAGGAVTDALGKPLDFTHGRKLEHNRGIIATNGRIHDTVVQAVGKVIGPALPI